MFSQDSCLTVLTNLYVSFKDSSLKLTTGFYSRESINDCKIHKRFTFSILPLILEFLVDTTDYRDLVLIVSSHAKNMRRISDSNIDNQMNEAVARGNLSLFNFYISKYSPIKTKNFWAVLTWYSSISMNPDVIISIINFCIDKEVRICVTIFSDSKRVSDVCMKHGINIRGH